MKAPLSETELIAIDALLMGGDPNNLLTETGRKLVAQIKWLNERLQQMTEIALSRMSPETYHELINEIDTLKKEKSEFIEKAESFLIDGHPKTRNEVTLKKMWQRDDSAKWAVYWNANAMDINGDWEWEPSPSSRSDDYLETHRFNSMAEALECYWEKGNQKKEALY